MRRWVTECMGNSLAWTFWRRSSKEDTCCVDPERVLECAILNFFSLLLVTADILPQALPSTTWCVFSNRGTFPAQPCINDLDFSLCFCLGPLMMLFSLSWTTFEAPFTGDGLRFDIFRSRFWRVILPLHFYRFYYEYSCSQILKNEDSRAGLANRDVLQVLGSTS